MTLAATRRYALALSGVVGVAATVIAAALITVVIGSPERVVLAVSDSELSAIVYLIVDRLSSVALALWRFCRSVRFSRTITLAISEDHLTRYPEQHLSVAVLCDVHRGEVSEISRRGSRVFDLRFNRQ